MKIRYAALLMVVSLLSLGAVTSCSTTSSTVETVAKVNPCASKANPSTSSKAEVGALAVSLQGKPVIVDIYASWCPACKNVAPALASLNKDYADKANFVVLDVSDQASTAKSLIKAKELGLEKFFTKNQAQTGLIAILDPANGNVLLEKQNNADVATYKQVLDTFKVKS
jgi:thiol-disulfide isomerase/thioredoxin